MASVDRGADPKEQADWECRGPERRGRASPLVPRRTSQRQKIALRLRLFSAFKSRAVEMAPFIRRGALGLFSVMPSRVQV